MRCLKTRRRGKKEDEGGWTKYEPQSARGSVWTQPVKLEPSRALPRKNCLTSRKGHVSPAYWPGAH